MSDEQSTPARPVEYRSIPGFPGYRVGDDGSVWSQWAKGVRPKRLGEWWRLKTKVAKSGHLWVTLYPGPRRWLVHQLVLEIFVGPRPPELVARHFPDRDPANNAVGNLSWATQKVNVGDKVAHGTETKGSRHGCAKLTEEKVASIRADYATGRFTMQELGAKHGIGKSAVHFIVKRQTWKHVA